MPILAPFEAFARDAVALKVDEDETRLPVKWLAAAQIAARLADSRPAERKALLGTWIRQQAEDGADGIWSVLAVPGIPVQDLPSASAALCHMAADMERGGALNLAYSTVTHMRISMLERGPAAARGAATLQQARILRQMGLLEEASDTFEEAREDAVRASDRVLEGRALIGMATLAGHRGNYPEVIALATRSLEVLPETSEYVADSHISLMVASMSLRDFSTAFEHGWKGYDAAANNIERRAAMVANLSSLALRRGRLRAARRGCIATLGLTQLERIVLPVLGNLSLVAAASNDVNELGRVGSMIERASASSFLPYELARARFELAQAWQQVGDLKKSEESLASARDLARVHGFHEVSFRSDLLAEAIAAAREQVSVGDARIEHSIARFDELAVDESVLVGA
jgi:tetratricopeptide (TPR) repeat protein